MRFLNIMLKIIKFLKKNIIHLMRIFKKILKIQIAKAETVTIVVTKRKAAIKNVGWHENYT